MSGRGIWIVALGAALAALIAFNVFRSEGPHSADAVVSRPPSADRDELRGEGRAANGAAQEAPASRSPDSRADVTAADSREAPTQLQPAPVGSSGPFSSISAALELHDVPPERRIPPIPEMVETERAFAAESVDPSWSTAAEASVLARFAEIPGLSLVSLNVECRATLCLLQFVAPQAPPPNYPNPNIAEIATSVGLKPLSMMGIRANGAPVMLAYLERADAAKAPAGDAEPPAP